jgi:hypothetical protein
VEEPAPARQDDHVCEEAPGIRQPFKHEDFRFGYEIALGSAYRGHADVGEVLSTAGRVDDGDADAWVRC